LAPCGLKRRNSILVSCDLKKIEQKKRTKNAKLTDLQFLVKILFTLRAKANFQNKVTISFANLIRGIKAKFQNIFRTIVICFYVENEILHTSKFHISSAFKSENPTTYKSHAIIDLSKFP
jgi:hypothetical protein